MVSSLRFLLAGAFSAVALLLASDAMAAGGSYVFDGGTPAQRAQVRAALEASSFDWGLVPATITIHIVRGVDSHSRPGHIWLDADLLDAGTFAWAAVQDEYAHQVDFFLFDDATRAQLNRVLGGRDWCYGVRGLRHAEYGCERFASTLVWTYWQSPDNAYRPRTAGDESAALPPAQFRRLMAELVGMPESLPLRTLAAAGVSKSAARKRR
ncbi:MAG TPA: hypothetical protein VM290_06635 [Gaiellaceae bacterium]|jgi:hypothetical protein|nr:hypothetical protein [Gaiellaceae bacterium]